MNKEMDKQTKDEKLKTDEIQTSKNIDWNKPLKDLVHSSELRPDGSVKEWKDRYLSKDGKNYIVF